MSEPRCTGCNQFLIDVAEGFGLLEESTGSHAPEVFMAEEAGLCVRCYRWGTEVITQSAPTSPPEDEGLT